LAAHGLQLRAEVGVDVVWPVHCECWVCGLGQIWIMGIGIYKLESRDILCHLTASEVGWMA
jgi:hypothetical protein